MDLNKAKKAFESYVQSYDLSIPQIHLKYVHTYAVLKTMNYLTHCLQLSPEAQNLAQLIALLHDIGRFEQWKTYGTFVDGNSVNHAMYSSELLFKHGLIRSFIEEKTFDHLIKVAIEQHNRYQIEDGFTDEELLYIHLIRDADKLDNYRVKQEESLETILLMPAEAIAKTDITLVVEKQFLNHQTILAKTRVTPLDHWLSYIAFMFDLNFTASYAYLKHHHYIPLSFERITPTNAHTKATYQHLYEDALVYLDSKLSEADS